MSSTEPATAEVRPFPSAKTAPAIEAPKVPAPPAIDTPAEIPAKKKRSVRSMLLPIIALGLLGAGAWYGYDYWTDGRFMISTDDAYVQADMAFISPKISGYVDQVKVTENQQVKAGDPLLTVDDGDYKIAVAQAEAQIATLSKTLDRIDAQTAAARASLQQAQAQKTADKAAADNAARAETRAAQLLKTHVSTQAQLDDAQTAVEQANAALAGADAQIAAAQANIGVLEAQRAETASTLASLQLAKDKAVRDLSFTVLRAPYDGVVGNRSVEQGDLISPGQKLAVIVPMDKLYIVANFKETQLARLVPGEKVRVSVDAIDGQDFEGTVSSLAPASGAVFSLLPPENATGNFTKVVQRVPVRIDVPADVLKTGKLRAGLSVIVAADSRTAPSASASK
ncbi:MULTISPECIES: HlyD family secretion protein [unclassified Mesorhizobium]|uniref:HlyD family secretion protein n=1 Tax=unclassified Mesorhizobium TaxID=325217 RepID=UPI000FDAED32|nr:MULTISPECIES: HlyD family secretion protein [unclassified Mesorhizobium]TGQ38676.1 HlyD family secretion protein [Mesorhizobium sp. M00.F.Ca.ET.216.01.1.1]TIS60093.1 MAG: HlyD family efflux transporter periplasmic adaptor subunit [Mesorhizobium sp.]TIS89506.1 MAG: HlyD family efflux transporter periplasmic adaptor subunit [Mesorhizobium sp.]TJW10454.1 MAG: HlyD family efflux transporter periplasmic adaptor subunit [Mesorhizobium sp.]TJW45556.1 MAG: HlyD family efflux transporter periplasmic